MRSDTQASKIQLEVFGLLADLRYQVSRCCAEVRILTYLVQHSTTIVLLGYNLHVKWWIIFMMDFFYFAALRVDAIKYIAHSF